MEVSLGEIFELIIHAKDENGNLKDAVYSYHSPKDLTTNPSNLLSVNLDPETSSILRFASVNKATTTVQKISLALRNELLKTDCIVGYKNSQYFNYSFNLNLIDSSDPRENRPSSHLGMIVEIPVLKVVISITSFCSC